MPSSTSLATILVTAGIVTMSLGGCGSPEDQAVGGSTSGDGEGSEGSADSVFHDLCMSAPLSESGYERGNMREMERESTEQCGHEGPDAFFRIEVPRRSDLHLAAEGEGFEPWLAVLPTTCRYADAFACSESEGRLELRNLAAGTQVMVAVGIESDEAALETLIDEGEEEGTGEGSLSDPLDFWVAMNFVSVLEAGALCQPENLGRCEEGTVCLPALEEGVEIFRCRDVPADTCLEAEPLSLQTSPETFSIEWEAPQSDAHHHSCMGEGTVERVYRLRLDSASWSAIRDGARLRITASEEGPSFALRASTCLAADEVACAASQEMGARLEWSPGGEVGEAPEDLFLFVEWPQDWAQSPNKAFSWRFEVVDG